MWRHFTLCIAYGRNTPLMRYIGLFQYCANSNVFTKRIKMSMLEVVDFVLLLENKSLAMALVCNTMQFNKILALLNLSSPCSHHCFTAHLTYLESRRDQLSRSFFSRQLSAIFLSLSFTSPSTWHICLVSAQNSHAVHMSYPTYQKRCSFIMH